MYWSLLFFGLIIGLFVWLFHQYQDLIYKNIAIMHCLVAGIKRYSIMTGLVIVVVIICYLGFRVWMG